MRYSVFGLQSVVGDDTIKRLFASINEPAGAAWVAQASAPLWGALPERLILDWDSTVQTKYGHQEGAVRGYNPVKPGRKSFHPLVAVGAGTRLCAAYRFRSGDTVTATQWQAAMEDAQAALGGRQVWLNRGDLGLGHEAIMAWHEAAPARAKYLFKLKLTANVRRALHVLPETAWQGPGEAGVWQVAEARVRLPGWTAERRVVFGRKLQGQTPALAQGQFWRQVKHELPRADGASVRAIAVRVQASQRGSRWRQPGVSRWLLIEQLRDDTFKYYLSNLPENTPLAELVRLAHQRWVIEQGCQQLKEGLGLDHFEGRTWRGLHHHLTLCFLAFCFLTRLRASKKRPSLPEVRRWLIEALTLCTCPRCHLRFTRSGIILDTS